MLSNTLRLGCIRKNILSVYREEDQMTTVNPSQASRTSYKKRSSRNDGDNVPRSHHARILRI